jgi:hypothetical protein
MKPSISHLQGKQVLSGKACITVYKSACGKTDNRRSWLTVDIGSVKCKTCLRLQERKQ